MEDHRLDGCLTLNEFNRLVIECILEHNTAHTLSDDYLDGDMIADSVEPYPRDLWKWGVKNRSGALRTLPADTVRRNLLPQGNALATPEGICFKKMLYTCDEAVLEQWFEQANGGKRRSLSVPIVYDPSVVDQIYVCLPGDPPLKACKLLEHEAQTGRAPVDIHAKQRLDRAQVICLIDPHSGLVTACRLSYEEAETRSEH